MKVNNNPLLIDKAIEGCLAGDRKSQEELYKLFYVPMMRLCMRYTQCEYDARSVLIAGFLKVFNNIQKFDNSKSVFSTWLHQIMINTCLDHIRSKKNIALSELENAADVFVQPGTDAKYEAEEILIMIRTLPPATQAVFNLYFIEGYAHKEIAEMLNISEGTSKWHLSEGKKKIKSLLLQKENNSI